MTRLLDQKIFSNDTFDDLTSQWHFYGPLCKGLCKSFLVSVIMLMIKVCHFFSTKKTQLNNIKSIGFSNGVRCGFLLQALMVLSLVIASFFIYNTLYLMHFCIRVRPFEGRATQAKPPNLPKIWRIWLIGLACVARSSKSLTRMQKCKK